MEETIKILIYIHAFFGAIGLTTGIGNIILKKGNSFHKSMGKIFSYSMIISSLISLVIAKMLVWILPTIIGTAYIIYWNRKLKTVAKY